MLSMFKKSKVSAPLMADLPIADVEVGGMPRLMVSRIPLAYFLVYLLEEYCSENLFFYLEVSFYNSHAHSMSEQQLEAHANHIYKTYLEPDSLFEVNIEAKDRKDCKTALTIKSNLPKIFEAVTKHIFTLLEASFAKFMRSPYAARLRLEQDGHEEISVTLKSRDDAVGTIVERLREQKGQGSQLDPEAAKKRSVSLQHMVAEFCKTVLDVEVEKTLEMINSTGAPSKSKKK
ncbi:RGS domain-containing protein [Zopfochytrium polystomum]|nr:RGS domain-containing protein [Zopfochytrium polystomum]